MTIYVDTSFELPNFYVRRTDLDSGTDEHWRTSDGIGDQYVGASGDLISGGGEPALTYNDRIIVAANYDGPGARGGMGLRHFRDSGENNNGGGLNIANDLRIYDIWIRFVYRWSAGWSWNPYMNYTKDVYWNVGFPASSGGTGQFGVQPTAGYGEIGFNIYAMYYTGNQRVSAPSTTFAMLNDNQWHWILLHMAMNDVGQDNGVLQLWIDGTRYLNRSDIRMHDNETTKQWFRFFQFANNQASPAGLYYTDFDELTVADETLAPMPFVVLGKTPIRISMTNLTAAYLANFARIAWNDKPISRRQFFKRASGLYTQDDQIVVSEEKIIKP